MQELWEAEEDGGTHSASGAAADAVAWAEGPEPGGAGADDARANTEFAAVVGALAKEEAERAVVARALGRE
jgi:hypothetical protein